MPEQIEVGDTVTVTFSTHPPLMGEVLYKPQATGDCWHIRSAGGALIYVQQFDFIEKHMHG